VRSVKEECLDRLIPLGERHFRRALADFVVHYHSRAQPSGLGNELIDGMEVQPQAGRVRRRQRVGGLLSYYYRAASDPNLSSFIWSVADPLRGNSSSPLHPTSTRSC
jgi:hypothetical protein